jgi:glycosyltransferase involved in cell wall biosynthesis
MDSTTNRPKVSKEPISVLLPMFNQAAGLEAITESWLRALARLGQSYELIVVDDASTDDSAEVIGKLVAKHSEIRSLRHQERAGYGAALRTGLAASTHPLVFYTACDYPYPPAGVSKLLDVIDSVDLITGCRTDPIPGWLRWFDACRRFLLRIVFGVTVEPRPGWLGWPAWWSAIKYRFLFGLRLWDPTSAYKLVRRSVLDRIPIQSNGEFVHVELLAKANFLGCFLAETPIGRLAGNFKGTPEPKAVSCARDSRVVFRRPEFASAKSSEPEA